MSFGRVLAAAAALAVLVRAVVRYRRGRTGKRKLAAWTTLAVALAVYAAGMLPPLPSAELILNGLAGAIGVYAYPLVGIVAFLETGLFLGLLTPGEPTVLLGGVVAGRGDISIVPLIGLVWLCSALGDSTGYLIGRRLGRAFLLRHGDRFHVSPDRLARVEGFFARRGGATVVIGRFVGVIRTLAPFVAGSSRMSYARFLPYSLLGTGLWSATFCLLGYFFYSSFARIAELAGNTGSVVGPAIVLVAAAAYAYRRLRHPEERERLRRWWRVQRERPALRPLLRPARWVGRRLLAPLGRAVSRPARFLLRRVTPGGLGIELTSALAAAAVGLYVFGLYVVLLAPRPEGLTPLDFAADQVLRALPMGPLVDVAAIVTRLGSPGVAAGAALAAAVWLTVRRRRAEAAALLSGLLLVFLTVQLAKAGVDRPRPAGALDPGAPGSYPSGHAAYAVTYVALALVAARGLVGAVRPTVLVSAGVALAALVALTRVYLRTHYLSDVAGGLGLGVGIYALCAAVAIVVGHLAVEDPARAGSAEPRARLRTGGTGP